MSESDVGNGPNPLYGGCFEGETQELADLRRSQAAQIATLTAERDLWVGLYRRAINEANGLTNYVEDRPELRSAEKRLSAIEAAARASLNPPSAKEM